MLSFKKIFVQNHMCTYWLSVFFIAMMVAVSCDKPEGANQSHFKTVLAKLDSSITILKDSSDLARYRSYTDAEIKYFDGVLAASKNPDPDDVIYWNIRKSWSYWNKHSSDTAILYLDSCINLLQNHLQDKKHVDLYIDIIFSKGDINAEKQNYDEAIRNYATAKLVLSSRKEDTLLFRYYHSMADILFTQHKYLLAVDFFRMICMIAPSTFKTPYEVFFNVQGNMDNIGECYYNAGLADSALYYYNATLDYIDQTEKKMPSVPSIDFAIHRAVVYGDKAAILQQKKDMKGAEELFLKSYEYFEKVDDRHYNNYLMTSLSGLYLETKQIKKAGEMLAKLASFIDTTEIKSTTSSYYKLLSDYYFQTKQIAASNNSLLRSYLINDSLNKRDKNFIATDIGKEFENKEQKELNETLKKDNEIKKSYLLTAIISSVLALVIISLAWNNLNRKSRFATKLTALNAELGRKNDDLLSALLSLEQSHRENNSIMRIVAHDLKNPIAAIRTIIYSLLKKEQTVEKREVLQLIQSSCRDSIALIKNLLDNKRSLSDISKELIDMGILIEQCAELFQAKAGEKKQHLKLLIDHPVVLVNRKNIMRVISNIVNNAIKFSPENTEIIIQLERKEDSVLFSVHDNGIGIPDRLKEKIFTTNSEILRAGEESFELSLSISRKIIEEHAGRLWFKSEAGKGSVFYVELPYSVN